MERDAHVDDGIKRVLEGCEGDPKKVEAKIDDYLASEGYNPHNDIFPRLGRDEVTRIVFRAYNPGNIWVRVAAASQRPSERWHARRAPCAAQPVLQSRVHRAANGEQGAVSFESTLSFPW